LSLRSSKRHDATATHHGSTAPPGPFTTSVSALAGAASAAVGRADAFALSIAVESAGTGAFAGATGALGNATTAPKARIYYVANYFDPANRPTATVNVGTNGGTAYARPSSVPTGSTTILVTSTVYNAAGWAQDVTDPRGIDTRTSKDALGRPTQTIQD